MLIYTSLLLTLVHLVSVYNVLSHSVKLLTPFVHTLVFLHIRTVCHQEVELTMLFPMCRAAYCVGLDFSTLVRFGSVFNVKYSVSFFFAFGICTSPQCKSILL